MKLETENQKTVDDCEQLKRVVVEIVKVLGHQSSASPESVIIS